MSKNNIDNKEASDKDTSLFTKGMMFVKTLFFKNLLGKGASYLGSPAKAADLISKGIKKTRKYESFGAMFTDIKDSIFDLFRMVKDYATGDYREIEFKKIALITAGVIYLVSPIDIVPDVIPVMGLMDDLSVLTWIIGTLSSEIRQYQIWRKNKVIILPKAS